LTVLGHQEAEGRRPNYNVVTRLVAPTGGSAESGRVGKRRRRLIGHPLLWLAISDGGWAGSIGGGPRTATAGSRPQGTSGMDSC